MTECVVDILELIQIEKQDSHPIAVALRTMDAVLHPVVEETPIGQVGQRIVIGEKFQFGLGTFALFDLLFKRTVEILNSGKVAGNLQR